jgi:hypothetical protein
VSFSQKKSELKFHDGFELGHFKDGWRVKEITKNNGYKIDTVTRGGRFNDNFLITYTRKTGEYGVAKRSEFSVKLYDSINYTKFLSFSFKVPNSLKFDAVNLGRETMICQWHSKPAPGKDWNHYKKYLKYNRPSVALYLTTNNNKDYYLVLRYGNNGKPQFEQKDYKWSTISVKKIEKDKWYDMVFEINWSFTNSGYIAVWMNNEPFTPFNGMHNKVYGPNMHNESPAYFKFGQYRYWDDSNEQEVYFDELRIGNSFEEVSIYKSLPAMFQEMEKFYFIKNHK